MAVSSLCYWKDCDEPRHLKGGYCETHAREYSTRVSDHKRSVYVALRRAVFGYYGGKCECCGDSTLEFLTIDHVAGVKPSGVPEWGRDLYMWLVRNDYPDGFRALCHNCNFAYGVHGICPHVYSL